MSDYSEAELSAVEAVFPNTKTYLCDFHREQAWLRWCRDQKHGLIQTEADNLLTLLRACAWAPSTPDDQDPAKCYKEAVAQLKSSQVWQNHASVRQWLSSKWLPIPEVMSTCQNNVCILNYPRAKFRRWNNLRKFSLLKFSIQFIFVLYLLKREILLPSKFIK